MFADKESFVTSAYRAKMEEMAKEEEEEERKSRIESALDVTKQKDLSGFYRHLYRLGGGRGGLENYFIDFFAKHHLKRYWPVCIGIY